MANGMMEEAGMVPPSGEAPAPTEETMVAEDEAQSMADDISEDAIVPLEKATEIAYSEKLFPKIVKMFEDGGPEGFPDAMAASLLGVMQKLQMEEEGLSDQVLAEVGATVFEMLTEDIASSGKVEGLTPEIITSAVQKSIKMWAEANPDRFDPQVFEQEAMAALGDSGELPPVTPNPEQRGMTTDAAPQRPMAPPQGGGMLTGGM